MPEEQTVEAGRWMRMPEAVRYGKMSQMTLRRLEEAGELRFLRPRPRVLLIDRIELDKYLESLRR
jgi:excisionase family DNA binding protein